MGSDTGVYVKEAQSEAVTCSSENKVSGATLILTYKSSWKRRGRARYATRGKSGMTIEELDELAIKLYCY